MALQFRSGGHVRRQSQPRFQSVGEADHSPRWWDGVGSSKEELVGSHLGNKLPHMAFAIAFHSVWNDPPQNIHMSYPI